MPDIDVIAWDFDGVLNRNVIDGKFIWTFQMEKELGYCPREFMREVIGDFSRVMAGEECVLERLKPWLDRMGYQGSAEDFAH